MTAALVAPLLISLGVGGSGSAATPSSGYTVLIETGASRTAAIAAVQAAGGVLFRENPAAGTLTVTAPKTGFIEQVTASAAVFGAARDFTIEENTKPDPAEQTPAATAAQPVTEVPTVKEPLEEKQWGFNMVRGDLAREKQLGDPRVYVGVLDSGIDGSHPDLSGRLDRSLSRNFTRDVPSVDGPCEVASCVDPADVDDDGHGTHVAGIIAAGHNKFGMAGVAPNITLVSLRATQDSGYAFLQPVIDALTYGADVGIDVINMSFFIDPWRYNCAASPNDTPEHQIEQRTIVAAYQRALDYAHSKGVTLVSSLGNNHDDLGKPRTDTTSPAFPPNGEYQRPIDNATCSKVPTELDHVLGVSALGPSRAKSNRSDYGVEQIDLSAPGGFLKDFWGTPWYEHRENRILSTYSRSSSLAQGFIDANGDITPLGDANNMLKHCVATTCAYYRYLDGTSMAAPHASATAALTVSQYGKPDPAHPGTLTLSPTSVERVLKVTADKTACPEPRTVSYEHLGLPAEYNATCEGDLYFNGFYGHGVVNAFAAVTRGSASLSENN